MFITCLIQKFLTAKTEGADKKPKEAPKAQTKTKAQAKPDAKGQKPKTVPAKGPKEGGAPKKPTTKRKEIQFSH